MRTLDKRGRVLVLVAVIGGAISFPLGVVASHRFTDVPASNTFHDDIDAIAAVGVTTGCAANLYCPKDYVTREQMAAFLNRLGALGPGKTPVVNADMVDGKDALAFLPSEDITTMQLGPWGGSLSGNLIIAPFFHGTSFSRDAGTSILYLHLHGVSAIGGVEYGFKSVEVCFGDSPDVSVLTTVVSQGTSDPAAPGLTLVEDPTDRDMADGGCYAVTDATPTAAVGGSVLGILLEWDSESVASIEQVTTTWKAIRS
jgi:hypothetical protein